jgi:hypothetical protein
MLTAKEIIKLIDNSVTPTIYFEEDFGEYYTEKGMIADCVSYYIEEKGSEEEFPVIILDLEKYIFHNVDLEKPLYFGNKTASEYFGKPLLKESLYVYYDDEIPAKLITENALLKEYIDKGSDNSYMQWLESQLSRERYITEFLSSFVESLIDHEDLYAALADDDSSKTFSILGDK